MELLQQHNQVQVQKLSARQIQAINMLAMSGRDLRDEIYREASENPALEIVSEEKGNNLYKSLNHSGNSGYTDSQKYQAALESKETHKETLQQHLMEQLNMTRVSEDEFELCQKLIYNLDKNGCYGSMIAPQTLLNKARPVQNQKMLERCLDIIQRMDPVGTCCKNPEESLLVQARIYGDADPLTLFLLDNHLDFLSPPMPEKVARKVNDFKKEWHSKKFATALIIDDFKIDSDAAQKSIEYILRLNPKPAGEYSSDYLQDEYNIPDVVLKVKKVSGHIPADEFENGKVSCDGDFHLQVKYASGIIPEIRISKEFEFDKVNVERARAFIDNIKFRESTIALQGCAIVSAQKDFFVKGPDFVAPLSRRQIAKTIGVHESTVSRLSSKNCSKFIECEWGVFPISYFFSAGVEGDGGEKISSQVIKSRIVEIVTASENISDSELTRILNAQGIKIARRTVAKYRLQAGIRNSYERN